MLKLKLKVGKKVTLKVPWNLSKIVSELYLNDWQNSINEFQWNWQESFPKNVDRQSFKKFFFEHASWCLEINWMRIFGCLKGFWYQHKKIENCFAKGYWNLKFAFRHVTEMGPKIGLKMFRKSLKLIQMDWKLLLGGPGGSRPCLEVFEARKNWKYYFK